MTLLPLAGFRPRGMMRHHGRLQFFISPRQRASWIASLARRIRDAFSEMNRQTRSPRRLMFSNAVAEIQRAPDTYAEFLIRCRRGADQPAARCRAAGRPVR